MIEMEHVYKDFQIYQAPEGFLNKVRSLFARSYATKHAVEDISFTIDAGEIVGYVGPNGAGKSTTIKMLSGILTPTRGRVMVDGIEPYKRRVENAQRIGVVFGQRSQLYWDLPMRDTFELHRKMYGIDSVAFRENVALFTEVLQMEKFIDQPVRQLSLGQKMRANIALSLLHNPKIVYLDEPTIGLDIIAKSRIRDFILEVNRLRKTTFILTTHDMDDIERVCGRLIMINMGRKYFDGSLDSFRAAYGYAYRIDIRLGQEQDVQHPDLRVAREAEMSLSVTGDKRRVPIAEAVAYLTREYDVRDIRIQESDVESILKRMYDETSGETVPMTQSAVEALA